MLRVAACQLAPTADLPGNLARARALVEAAIARGATLVGLPETFTTEYRLDLFPTAAEAVGTPGTGSGLLAELAAKHHAAIFGGVVEKAADGTLYNTAVVYGPEGELARYRKQYLSCVRVGPDTTSEATVFAAGEDLAVFRVPTPGGGSLLAGLGICFDLRFGEVNRSYAERGCDLVAYPSAFLESTGVQHWEVLLRARALDEQMFTLAPNHARSTAQTTKMFGHALACDPWGVVLACSGLEGDDIAVADFDLSKLDIRTRIPLTTCRSSKRRRVDATSEKSGEAVDKHLEVAKGS
uniref:CN hydrolase domain-containing protein n=1 Tax=Alexandrium monilatum TaxID=311494 RepID=A0A7S4SHK0_9DINO